jgi:hypothetical protein
VTLVEPLLIDSTFDYVDSIGMVRMQVCYNETVVGLNGCQVIDLSLEIVNDSHFEAARIFLTLVLFFGIYRSYRSIYCNLLRNHQPSTD